VRLAYSGLHECGSYYRQAVQLMRRPVERDGMSAYLPAETPEEKEREARVGEFFDKWAALRPSEAMLAGTILQAAYMAIALFSRNSFVPPKYARLVQSKSAVRFCVGEELHGVPTGLIVFAARHQFSHWDEPDVHEQTRAVFDALASAFMDNPWADLAFDLGNPTIGIYAAEVLFTALGWDTYEKYLAAMTQIVHSASAADQRPAP
jgi:hypothetical protein